MSPKFDNLIMKVNYESHNFYRRWWNLLTSISIALERRFQSTNIYWCETALIGLTRNPPDLAILYQNAKNDGEELLKIRKNVYPNNFLTSKDEEVDELLGLKLGADDFVKKSGGFSMKF